MCPICSYHLREMKLLIKFELLQSWSHGFQLTSVLEGASLITGMD